MKRKRIIAGVISMALVGGLSGVYPVIAPYNAYAEGTTDTTEKEETRFIDGGYDATRATVYSESENVFSVNGRDYNDGIVFTGQYSYQKSTASISYNVEGIKNISLNLGHIDNSSLTSATLSIYLDDVLSDKVALSSNMLQQNYSFPIEDAKLLKISVEFEENAQYAITDLIVDGKKESLAPVVPEYSSVESFISDRYNSYNYSTFSAVSDLEAKRINGRYYYEGAIFTGQYSYQKSKAYASFNTENVNKFSCVWGHIDNTSMTNATVSVYLDGVLMDKFALSATMPMTDYSVDVSDVAELRLVVEFDENAQFAMTDIAVDENLPAKAGKAPEYKTTDIFISDCYNKVNMSTFSAVSDLEAVKVCGRYYYQGMVFAGQYSYTTSTSIADFNVENVDSISGTLGHVDNSTMNDAVLSIYKDNVLTEKIELSCHMLPQLLTIDTKDCKNLRLSVKHNENAKFAFAEISVNESKPKKTFKIPDYMDNEEFINSAFDKINTKTFDFASDLDAYTVNGEKCYNGIAFAGAYSYTSTTHSFNANVENVNTVSWNWAHVDDTALENATVQIYLDRTLTEEVKLTSDMLPTKQVMDVSKASKLRIIVTNESNATYVMKDIEISDEIITPQIRLGDVNDSGVVDSADASAVLAEYAVLSTNGTATFTDTQKKSADINSDGAIDSSDASKILEFYSYVSTGGEVTDMAEWLELE